MKLEFFSTVRNASNFPLKCWDFLGQGFLKWHREGYMRNASPLNLVGEDIVKVGRRESDWVRKEEKEDWEERGTNKAGTNEAWKSLDMSQGRVPFVRHTRRLVARTGFTWLTSFNPWLPMGGGGCESSYGWELNDARWLPVRGLHWWNLSHELYTQREMSRGYTSVPATFCWNSN